MRVFPDPTRSGHRVLALIVAFGALVLLLIMTVTSTQAFVTKVGETTLVDFASGQFYRTSLYEPTQSVQLVPIGLSGQWVQDLDHPLPLAVTELSAVAGSNAAADKGQIVVMGGFDASFQYHDEVYISTINEDGSLGGWQPGTPLPQSRAAAAAVIYPRDANSAWIYLLGGTDAGGNSLNTAYYTVLDHDTGSISDWNTTTPLSMPVRYEGAATWTTTPTNTGYIYVIGGYWVESPFPPDTLDSVYYAQIQPDGSLAPWQETEPLPEPLSSLLVIAYSEEGTNTLYAIGGWDRPGAPSNSSFRVYFADMHPDGSLSPWQLSQGSLPAQIYAHSGVQANGQILVTGGRDATNEPSNTVKAALIDPTNPGFRLYDWCLGVVTCTIGAWQSGPVLPEPRAFHVTVQDRGYIYTLGGVDSNGDPTNVVYWGSTNGVGALYAPWGHYTSSEFNFGGPTTLRKVEWDTTIASPNNMSLKFRYRYKPQGQEWQPWSAQTNSVDGLNTLSFNPPIDDVRLFQYRVDMTTNLTNVSPLLNSVDVYYEVNDPEVSVRKDTGSVITVALGSALTYTVYFTNSGEWVAENVVLTETLPANSSYAGGPEWHQVGASNLYTYAVGNMNPSTSGQATFRVRIADQVPSGTLRITNAVDINYPPMTDALGETIVDPQPGNNHSEFSNPLVIYHLSIEKDATPAPGSMVERGDLITYTLSYVNDGSAALSGVILTDVLPAIVSYVQGSIWPPTEGNADDPAVLKWNVGDLASGANRSAHFAAIVKDTAPDQARITNTFTIDSLQTDPLESPSIVHTVTVPLVSFVVTKTATPPAGSVVLPTQRITYTLTYLNNGTGPASGVVLTDSLPAEVTYVPGTIWPASQGDASDPEVLKWTIGDVAPGSPGSARFVATVNEDVSDGISVTNRFIIDSAETFPKQSPVVEHLVHVPAAHLVLTKTAVPGSDTNVLPGQQIAYTLQYFSDGELPITDLTLTDTLPNHVSYVPGSIWPSAQGDDSDPDQLRWTIGDVALNSGGSVGFAVTVDDVPGGLIIENSFVGGSAETIPQPSNTVTHTTYRQAPDFVITKIEPVPFDPTPGSPFNLIVTVKNVGSQDADSGDFWVEVYVRPSPSTWPAGPSDHYLGMCTTQPCSPPYRYEYVEGLTNLDAGASYPLQFTGLVLPGNGDYDVYAQADISFEGDNPNWGRYLEANEGNNVRYIPLGRSIICLPLVFRNY
jgi:uncharacterized repeat protein (TIGR01451 family)